MSEANQTVEVVNALKDLSSVWVPVVSLGLGSLTTYLVTVKSKNYEVKLQNKQLMVNDILIPLGRELEKIFKSETFEISESVREVEKYVSVDKRIHLNKNMRSKMDRYTNTLRDFDRLVNTGVNAICLSIESYLQSNIPKHGYNKVYVSVNTSLKNDLKNTFLTNNEKPFVFWSHIDLVCLYNEHIIDGISISQNKLTELSQNMAPSSLNKEQTIMWECFVKIQSICDSLQIDKNFAYISMQREIITQHHELQDTTFKLLSRIYKTIDRIVMS